MGYRVSKSEGLLFGKPCVKEQRVDGSCLSAHVADRLRCTLMARENGYQLGILSNLKSKSIHHFSTVSHDPDLPIQPWFVTGFTDAEGSFMIKLSKSTNGLGLKIQLDFSIGLHVSDL